MGDTANEDQSERVPEKRRALTAEHAAVRFEALDRVYDERYLSRDLLESLKREIEASVERTDVTR